MKPPAFQILSQEYKRNPYPTLSRMLEQGPVVRIVYPFIGSFWAVTPYDAVNELLRDHRTFVRDARTAGLKKGANLPWWFPRFLRGTTEGMILRDEPDHRRLRSLVEQAFVRRNIDQLRPRFEAIASRMIDDLETQFRKTGRPVDLVTGLARPFPLAVICELLGLPHEDRQMFIRQAESFANRPSILSLIFILWSMSGIDRYVRRQIEAVQHSPREGLISELIAAEQQGQKLTHDETAAMLVLLLFAGFITTVHLIGGGVFTLLEHPDQKALLLADWSLAGRAVDEMLRYLSPVQTTKALMPVRDLDWHGHNFRRGENIVALLAAANVDPQQFPEPERFDIRRAPNPHVAFGAGPHVCLGWKLAVAECEIAVQQLFTHFPQLELAVPPSQVKWSRQPGTRGMESLPLRLW
jgi:cytochrome P450